MAPPPRPPEASIEAPPVVMADATPEQQLTHALASFQAEVSPITAADLAWVVQSARPAFRRGIGWSAHLREQLLAMPVTGAGCDVKPGPRPLKFETVQRLRQPLWPRARRTPPRSKTSHSGTAGM